MEDPRLPHTKEAYELFKKELNGDQDRLHSFDFSQEKVIRTFKHWIIIENRFPYDTITRTNHMLVSLRPLLSHYEGTQEEQEEYHTILKLLAEEGFYDAMIENFPKIKSVKKFVHIHLIQWHNT